MAVVTGLLMLDSARSRLQNKVARRRALAHGHTCKCPTIFDRVNESRPYTSFMNVMKTYSYFTLLSKYIQQATWLISMQPPLLHPGKSPVSQPANGSSAQRQNTHFKNTSLTTSENTGRGQNHGLRRSPLCHLRINQRLNV
jgi:hypothetical protein